MRLRIALTVSIDRDRPPGLVERDVQLDSLVERAYPDPPIGFAVAPPPSRPEERA